MVGSDGGDGDDSVLGSKRDEGSLEGDGDRVFCTEV
ncbi:hypothetical protein A2U01_0066801, partial [Trifolium medium]|nr:hypothetical protein [Trifolium medium]